MAALKRLPTVVKLGLNFAAKRLLAEDVDCKAMRRSGQGDDDGVPDGGGEIRRDASS